MQAGLKSGPFLDSLAKREVVDADDLRQRASKYSNMEQVRESKQANNRDKKSNQESGKKLASRIEVLPKLYEPRGLKYVVYTPLNTTRAKILDEIIMQALWNIHLRVVF